MDKKIRKASDIENQLDKHIANEEKPIKETKDTQNELIEKKLAISYEFRNNIIKCKPEFRKTGEKNWIPIDNIKLNSLRRELNNVYGIATSTANISQIIESDYAERVNPIHQYFEDLPKWKNDKDYIQELCYTISCKENNFYNLFKKWLVAVVANAITPVGCQNHTMLVICGEQGKFKTTWLDNLCPKALQLYHYNGKIKPDDKDSLTRIAEYFLINIDDQLKQLNKKDENDIKNLITIPFVKYRRPYDRYDNEYPHMGSFMGSVNGIDFLTDPTGSRRFLPFEVDNINIDAAKKIDMDKVYSQAHTLWKEGFQFWFNDAEVEALHKHNTKFQVTPIEEELILQYFSKPERPDQAQHYLPIAIIQSDLERIFNLKINTKKLGESLRRIGFQRIQKTIQKHVTWVYAVNTIEVQSTEPLIIKKAKQASMKMN